VEIAYGDKSLERLCNDDAHAKKKLGPLNAKKLRARLDDLDAAATLAVMRTLPGGCHELKADLAGCLGIDLHKGFRIVITPGHDPVPIKGDGGLDWALVTAVRVVKIGDYHD